MRPARRNGAAGGWGVGGAGSSAVSKWAKGEPLAAGSAPSVDNA